MVEGALQVLLRALEVADLVELDAGGELLARAHAQRVLGDLRGHGLGRGGSAGGIGRAGGERGGNGDRTRKAKGGRGAHHWKL